MQTINWRAIAVKKIILLLLFIVTTILFLFNSKVVLNISSNHKIDGSISYITPLSAEFEKGGQFPFTLKAEQLPYRLKYCCQILLILHHLKAYILLHYYVCLILPQVLL